MPNKQCFKCGSTTTYMRNDRNPPVPKWGRDKDKNLICGRCDRRRRDYKYKKQKAKYQKQLNQNQKRIVMYYYSNGKMCCDCCGETIIEFLTIDHINNDGSEHRKAIKRKIYGWLIKNNFPEGFRVLCFNCNCARYYFGECPHNA